MNKHLAKNWYVQQDLCYDNVVYNNQQCASVYTNYNGTIFANYLYTGLVYPSNVGNSVEVRTAVESPSVAELSIADGAYQISAYVNADAGIVSIGAAAISLDVSQFTTYKLSLLNGEYKLYINQALVAQGNATSSTDTPSIFYGFKSNPVISDKTYVSHIESGRVYEQTFIVGEWYLNSDEGYTKTRAKGISCAKIFPHGEDNTLPTFFYKDDVFDTYTGNTISAKLALGGSGEDSQFLASDDTALLMGDSLPLLIGDSVVSGPVQICIADGTSMVVADISEGEVSIGSDSYALDTLEFHNYWLTLKEGKYQLFIDKVLVLEGEASSSISRRLSVGFTRTPNDYDSAYIKYLKSTKGEKRPIDISKVSCELQVDTSDSFDTVNLKTYYSVDDLVFAEQDGAPKAYIDINSDNTNVGRIITVVIDGIAGSPVPIAGGASASSIAYSIFANGIPAGWTPEVDGTRITLTKNSGNPVTHATDKYNYIEITGNNNLDITLELFHRGTALGSGIVRSFTIPLLPRQEDRAICYFFRVRVNSEYYTSDWAYYFYDEPDVDIVFTTKEKLSENKYIVDKLVAFCYENRQSYILVKSPTEEDKIEGYVAIKDSTAIWKPINNSYFLLDSNNTNHFFDQVYNYRMPDEEVYTKYDYSGNIANAISSEATVIDIADFEIKNTTRDLDVHLCRDSYLYNNFGSLYSLAAEYFNTINEYRDTLVNIIDGFCNPGNTKALKNILAGITGIEPYIEELKNTKKWILWDRATLLTKKDSERYVLFNPEHPYSTKNKAVLYTAQGKAFTFNIHLYNPLGLTINPEMVKIIVDLFKPNFSQANLIFYDEEGFPVVYPAEYYFSNYGQGLYYAADTLEEA